MPAGNDKSRVGRLLQVPTAQIRRNPQNPRQTFNQARIEKLAQSIEEIGLQVPITVYEDGADKDRPYVLLDGERRFRAVQLINAESVPALVVKTPTATDNAVRMFNIHMLREDWREIETAWALEAIIKETGIDGDRELQRRTGLSIDRIRNMKRVLAFPRKWQEKVAKDELPYQLLVELDKNVLSREDIASEIFGLSSAKIRDAFLKKFEEGIEKDVVDLRKVGTLLDTAKTSGKVAQRAKTAVKKLLGDSAWTIEDAFDEGAAASVELSKVLRDIGALPGRIGDLLDGNLDQEQRERVIAAVEQLREELEQFE